MTQRRQPRPHFNEPEVAFNDAEALQLVRSIIGDWPWFKTAHLSSEQAHEAWRASSDAGFAYAIALARDGDFHLLAEMHRIWRTGPRVRDFPEEAYQLMEARLVGRAQRAVDRRAANFQGMITRANGYQPLK
jgi:hypothetical protein